MRPGRWVFATFWRVALAALVVMAAGAPTRAENILVKMATLVPQGSSWHQALQELAENWKKASNGQVTLRLYPGGVAGDDTDVIRKMRLGTLNAAFVTSQGIEEIDRAVLAMQIPLAYENFAELDCVLDRMSPDLERRMAEKGFVLIGWSDGGFVRFFTKSPARTPDELKPMKMFTWAGDDRYVELWKNAGFNPVPLPSTEISTALQTGLINALATTPEAMLLLQWYNQAKCMTELDWAVLLGGFIVNKSTWDKIPPELRPALEASARETGRRLRDLSRESMVRNIEAMQKRGLQVVKLTAAERDAWRKTIEEIYPKVRGPIFPPDAFDAALRHRDECRREMQGKKGQ